MSLHLHQLTKTYGRHPALDRVSLHVRKGDCYGFLGHNGAGKTTAMRIALGLVRPNSGRVLVCGFDAAEHRREANARMGALIERPGFYGALSGHRNLVLLGRLQGLERAAAIREAGASLDAVGLSTVGDKPVRGYSQGMRQRLGIAQALLGGPEIVLLDEPTNGLDPEGIEEMRRLFRRLTHDEGRTVILSSHQLHEIAGLCNRVGILREGRLLVEETTDALLEGNAGRLVLDVGDAAKAAALLTQLGAPPFEERGTAVVFDGESVSADTVVRAAVAEGLAVRSIAPQPPNLEEIYLRFTRGGSAVDAPDRDAPATNARPATAQAPGGAVLSVVRHELSRWRSSPGVVIALALPALLAAVAVARLWAVTEGHLEEVDEGFLFSQTLVTAFEGIATGLSKAMPLAALVVAGIASQSFAGELARGTLRNEVVRPLGRLRIAVGKALAVLVAAFVAYGGTVVAATLASALLFEFTDVVEILEIRSAKTLPVVSAEELWPVLRASLPAAFMPLAAYGALGLLASAATRAAAPALALAGGLVVLTDLLRVPGRAFGFDEFLLAAHHPSPLGDTSPVSYLLSSIQAPNEDPTGSLGGAWVVGLAWAVLCVVLAAVLFQRREIR